jgi:Rab GDP dissociation inhibitor
MERIETGTLISFLNSLWLMVRVIWLTLGNLVKVLLTTNVSQYLDWKCIDGTFVYQWNKGGLFSKAKGAIHKVPANDKEAFDSDLMGLFEKNRCRKFFSYIQEFNRTNPKTHKGTRIIMT